MKRSDITPGRSCNDLYARLGFVGANDWDQAAALEAALTRRHRNTRHGEATRLLGLPACRALMAFGRGSDALAVTLLASLPARAHRLGRHAQRHVLHLTLRHAAERMRRPGWLAPRIVPASSARAAQL